MAVERSVDPLTDAALDRAIQSALAVEPSPELLARVRRRIADEPAPSSWGGAWMFAVAGLAVAAIMFAIVVSRPEHNAASGSTIAGVAIQADPKKDALPASPRSAEAFALPPAKALAPAPAEAFARRPREPEILLDPDETRALRRLITGTRDGSLDLSASLRATTPTAMDLPEISDVVISPITIEPLAPPAGAEGVRP
jgi:hypothetical protein